jgi:hypothetical protein
LRIAKSVRRYLISAFFGMPPARHPKSDGFADVPVERYAEIYLPMAFGEFVFAMTDALVNQIVAQFGITGWSPLTQEEIDSQIPLEKRSALGVYLLGRESGGGVIPLYVGQSNAAIYDRLSRHAKFLQDRYGLPYEAIRFKALAIVIFDSVALETRLIDVFQTKWDKKNPVSGWNGSGIGSNDTGGGRDRQKPSGFDQRFPIDVTLKKRELDLHGSFSPRQIFAIIKSIAPFTVRFAPTALGQSPDLDGPQATIEQASATVLSSLQEFLALLPVEWSIQINPVRILVQKGVDTPAGSLVNPATWPPAEWLAGQDRCVVLRRV